MELKPFLLFQEEKPLVSVGCFLMVESNLYPGFNRPEGYSWVNAIAGHGYTILCTVKYDEKYCIMHGGTFKNIIFNDMEVFNPNKMHIVLISTRKSLSSPSSSASDSSNR